jgi:hypothetical protein
MTKFINLSELVRYLFDQEVLIQKATQLFLALFEARSPRISQIAERMPGNPAANYKAIQRFIAQVDLKAVLLRFFQEQAEYVIGDRPRSNARKPRRPTMWANSDGKPWATGCWYWQPLRGEPSLSTSSPTLQNDCTGHFATESIAGHSPASSRFGRAALCWTVSSLLELLQSLVAEAVHFVIRLKVGTRQTGLSIVMGNPSNWCSSLDRRWFIARYSIEAWCRST